MARLSFLGAARTVTGSQYLLEAGGKRLMVDCGMTEGTLGRALVEGAKEVRIHKGKVPVLADVRVLRALSGHADSQELMRWLEGARRPPMMVFVTHGEEDAALTLADRIAREGGFRTRVPEPGEIWELGAEG